MHVDKTSLNLNTCKEGSVSSELFISSKSNKKLYIATNESDGLVTMIGFTNSCSNPILCVAIIKGQT